MSLNVQQYINYILYRINMILHQLYEHKYSKMFIIPIIAN